MDDSKKSYKKADGPPASVAQRSKELEMLVKNDGSYGDLKKFIAREEAMGDKGNRELKIVGSILRMYVIVGLYETEYNAEVDYCKETLAVALQYQTLRGSLTQKDLLADPKIQAWQKKLEVRDFGSIINLFFANYLSDVIQVKFDAFCDQFLEKYRAKAPDRRSPDYAHWILNTRDRFSFLADEFKRLDELIASVLIPGSEYDVLYFTLDDSINTFFGEVYRDLEYAISSEELLYAFTRKSMSHLMPKTDFYARFMAWAISWHCFLFFIKELAVRNNDSTLVKLDGPGLAKTYPFAQLKRMVVRYVPERECRIKAQRSSVVDYHDVLNQLKDEFQLYFPETNPCFKQ